MTVSRPASQGLGSCNIAADLGYGSRESFLSRPRGSAPAGFSASLPEYSNSGSPQTMAELAMALLSTNGRDRFPRRVSEDEKGGLADEIAPLEFFHAMDRLPTLEPGCSDIGV
ncbi:hypothetical protein CABS02_15123 [Colletotrichum abscissum]|uniref:Uncharacterized protein n=1 Tax=Colletotrichum abscissum TaxID=1671311 RepID=A0A9P9X0D0_9PEZI|nr:hypothetical protein CABS02_15123 [Colletotrichum abscissum]